MKNNLPFLCPLARNVLHSDMLLAVEKTDIKHFYCSEVKWNEYLLSYRVVSIRWKVIKKILFNSKIKFAVKHKFI